MGAAVCIRGETDEMIQWSDLGKVYTQNFFGRTFSLICWYTTEIPKRT